MEEKVIINLKYKHPKSGEILISQDYTILDLIDRYDETLMDDTCICDCQPIGETNVVECNCSDYYEDFELVGYDYKILDANEVKDGGKE